MTKQNMLPAPPKMVTFSITIEEGEQAKLMAFMGSDSWERAEKARHATIQECTKSLKHCVIAVVRASLRIFSLLSTTVIASRQM
jgi:hypothetical protein